MHPHGSAPAPVVAIRANDNCFLDLLRCFAQIEVPVVPVTFTWDGAGDWLSESSRFFHDPVRIANPAEDEHAAASQLVRLGARLVERYGRKILLIATSDTALVFVNRHFDRLGAYYLQAGAPRFDRSCWDQLHKDRFYRTLEEHGVPIPLTAAVNQPGDIAAAVARMTYPCIYKPSIKTIGNAFARAHSGKKAVECSAPAELAERLEQELHDGFQVVVQEKISFEKPEDEISCYLYADGQGNIRMTSAQYKLMEFPKRYGTGVVSRTAFSPEAADVAARTIEALGWHGFLGVELMFSKRHRSWVVIEANLRPWLSNYFQAAAGFNYPAMLYRDAMGLLEPHTSTKTPDHDTMYRVNLLHMVRKCVAEQSSVDEALDTVEAFLVDHRGRIVFSYAVPQDPEPGMREFEVLRRDYPGHEAAFDRLQQLVLS